MRIDIGCGASKKPGHTGIDKAAAPGVDLVVDFERERLPFDDGTVEAIYVVALPRAPSPTRACCCRSCCASASTCDLRAAGRPSRSNLDAFAGSTIGMSTTSS